MQDAGVQFYFRHNEETARQAKVLTRDEARRMGHPMTRETPVAAFGIDRGAWSGAY